MYMRVCVCVCVSIYLYLYLYLSIYLQVVGLFLIFWGQARKASPAQSSSYVESKKLELIEAESGIMTARAWDEELLAKGYKLPVAQNK
jgi:hypothetical protein